MTDFHTIGHSTRSVDELAGLLHEAGCDFLVDVRTIPRSRTNPQFNADAMPDSLRGYEIDYRHIAALGGLRGRRKDAPSPNGFWQNTSFRNYADHAGTAAFRDGLAELREIGLTRRCAIMCAEAVPWRCHRSLIGDALLVRDVEVLDIMSPTSAKQHTMTSFARVRGREITYPGD